jgi:Ca2+:H+ antiporter
MSIQRLLNLNVLLLFIPVALILNRAHAHPSLVFLTAALAIVPLAKAMGDATETLAGMLGPTRGGLLNATLGNAPEIIIGLFALSKGLVDMVKASITGSIVGNLLFGMGLAMLAGGLKFPKLNYDTQLTRLNGDLLMLALFGLMIPAAFHFSARSEAEISRAVAAVLFAVYLASLVFTLVQKEPAADTTPEPSPHKPAEASRGAGKALGSLGMATAGLALMSEILTDAVDPAARSLGLTPLFAGIFLLATVGNAAELFNAGRFARKNQMDLSIGMTIGASTQVALLVAPILVFASGWMGKPMNLLFSRLELVAILMAVAVILRIAGNRSATWLGGVMLIAVYAMLGFGFFYMPG